MRFRIVEFETFFNSSRWNAEYFLNNLVDRPVASGFRLRKLGELVDERREFLSPIDYPDTTFNYLGLENISQSTRLLSGFSPKQGTEVKSRSKVFRSGDILYGRLRPELNKCLIVNETLLEGICSTEIFVLIPNLGLIHPEYFAEILVSDDVQRKIGALVAGAALPRIQLSDFFNISVPIPSIGIQQDVASMLISSRQEFAQHVERARDLPQDIGRAFRSHIFNGDPFRIEQKKTRQVSWNNRLPSDSVTMLRRRGT